MKARNAALPELDLVVDLNREDESGLQQALARRSAKPSDHNKVPSDVKNLEC